MTRVVAPETEMGEPIGDNRKQAAGGGEGVGTGYTRQINGYGTNGLDDINRRNKAAVTAIAARMIRGEGVCTGNHFPGCRDQSEGALTTHERTLEPDWRYP